MKKKKEVPMPKLVSQKSKVVWKWWIATALAVGLIFGVAIWARNNSKKDSTEYIQKGVVNNYVCRIVGADTDKELVAVECLTK